MACDDQYTLKREGLTAQTRGLEALSPHYSPVDDRSLSDLVLFAKRYAAFVRYYGEENQQDGNWQPLMQSDVSVAWASLLALDGNEINRYQKRLYKNIDLAYRDGNRDEAKKQFKYLFDLLYGLVKTIDAQVALLFDQDGQGQAVRDVLLNKIASPYRKLRHLKNENPSLFPNHGNTDPNAPVDVADSNAPLELTLIDGADEALPVQLPTTTILNKIHYLAHHNVFVGQVAALLGGVSLAVKNAHAGFAKSLSEVSGHQPHYALFLAFLKLFGHAQDSLNQFGRRHLDFYYKEVLRLRNRSAHADTAYLTFELQKAVSQHKLNKGTLFKGAKDSAGSERQYALLEDVVLNTAKVAKIHAEQLRNGRLLVASVPGGADGAGEAIDTLDKSWFTFGNPAMAPTEGVGFGISSPMLLLQEGVRIVTLRFAFGASLPRPPFTREGELVSLSFTVGLTAAEGWWEQQVEAFYTVGDAQFELVLSLGVSDPPIVPYAEKLHERGVHTEMPLLLAYFRQGDTAVTYQSLMETPLTSVHIGLEVKGVKGLALSNDSGTIDNAKPFKPFGDFPKSGSSFNMGSNEVFRKKLTRLHINGIVAPTVAFEYLQGGQWKPLSATKETTAGRYSLALHAGTFIPMAAPDLGANPYWGVRSHEGILRMKLQDSTYALEAHIQKINDSLNNILLKIAETKQARDESTLKTFAMTSVVSEFVPTAVSEQLVQSVQQQYNFVEVWTPEIYAALSADLLFKSLVKVEGVNIPTPKEIVLDEFSIDYWAEDTIVFPLEQDEHTFYHVHPFGHYSVIQPSMPVSIVPDFPQAGALYIGLSDAPVPVTVSLLFEMAEGSANPLKPRGQVAWHYLDSANAWTAFSDVNVVDGTRNFSRTGIVTLSLPADAGDTSTRMAAGLRWIKASIQADTDTVCRMVAVHAQAGTVSLVQKGGIEFRELLPSGSISKFLTPDGAVKTVTQPTASFGGKPTESDDRFYTRVSERLRHKQRAITIWDYEHLVLGQFPEIYKVKCINHAGFHLRDGSPVFCEHLPGHVTLVPTPVLADTAYNDPLRPYTPVGLLVDIQQYLDELKDPFVSVHVCNPQFEGIKLEFDVKFHDQMDEVFHTNELNTDIERFLCPWAYDSDAQFSYGGRISKSALINFIDERPYVDYISTIKMHQIIRDDQGQVRNTLMDIEEARGSTARSVLVSYAQREGNQMNRHQITVIRNIVQV